MKRNALLVGINDYASEFFDNLNCCVDDVNAIQSRLIQHADGIDGGANSRNYACKVLSSEHQAVTHALLDREIDQLISGTHEEGDVLFYFSGHGYVKPDGGYLVTQDATEDLPGYPMSKLIGAANRSANQSVLIILDCCHSGQIGNISDQENQGQALIGPNVTVLTASAASEKSSEGMEFSLFTELVLEALDGGAADVRGHVHAASVYAYVERALAEWEQCPVYKSYSRRLNLVRKCPPLVSDESLAMLPDWFSYPEMEYPLNPAYTADSAAPDADKVFVLRHFSELRNATLLTADSQDDLHSIALESGSVRLTPLGHLFWSLASRGDFSNARGEKQHDTS